MCGILGIVGPALPDPARFRDALQTLSRRGPDDQGMFHEGRAMLGHTRLSIVDLSVEGHQPMVSGNGRYVVVFNGEVYNFQELRKELDREGVRLRSTGDTEVILELYARQGVRCIDSLRGMFALAIWDKQEEELFLLRDRLGIKPLYLVQKGGSLAFASELKALRKLGVTSERVDPAALGQFLAWGSVPMPHAMLEGVTSFPPGSWARFKNGKLSVERYWQIPSGPPSYRSRDEALEALRPALRESVALRCIADVPVGAFLSGGIDSSAVVSLMRAVGQRNLHTFSMTFPGTALDESRYAQEVAQQFDTRHTAAPIESDIVRDVLDDFFAVLDQPTCDGMNTYLVSRFAKLSGMTVALSGLGGDELFAGYPSFKRAQALGPAIGLVPAPLRDLGARALAPMHPKLAKLEAFTLAGEPMPQMYFASRGMFSPSQVGALVHPDLRNQALRAELTLPKPPAHAASPYHATMQLELTRYMHDQLLRDSDVFGMAHALEIRVPLIDHKVVEIVARTPAEAVLAGGQKALLRDALPTALPEQCTNRKKMGFTFPFDSWMRTSLKPMMEAGLLAAQPARLLDSAAVAQVWRGFLEGRVHWSRPWSLYVLTRWAAQSLAA